MLLPGLTRSNTTAMLPPTHASVPPTRRAPPTHPPGPTCVQDGVISSMEYQLSTDALNNIEGRDLKGDGVVSAEEEKHTRILEGRKMILKSFIARNVTDLRQIGPRFCRKSPKEVRYCACDRESIEIGGSRPFRSAQHSPTCALDAGA